MSTKLLDSFPYPNFEGTLTPIEFGSIPFTPVRIFWTKGIGKDCTGGNHAHHKTLQYVICLRGMIELDLYDGFSHIKTILQSNNSVFIDKLIWDSQKYLTGDDIMLVLCSTAYTPSDYIFDISEFEKIKRAK